MEPKRRLSERSGNAMIATCTGNEGVSTLASLAEMSGSLPERL